MQVSRHIVFHCLLLLGTGVYLISMAIIGHLIGAYAGEWGRVIQIGFLGISGAVLLAVLSSNRIRAQIRVFLSKHFFSYKYDYRREWTRFTENLSASDAGIPRRVLFALASLVQSGSGLLWLRREQGFELVEHWNTAAPRPPIGEALGQVALFAERQHWVIDIGEYLERPDRYPGLDLPEALLEHKDAWLLIPLFLGEKVIGIALLGKSEIVGTTNWEDHDLLKVAGRQAASELAQYRANRELIQARQFEAFNRLSAYVVHDLKNILAQQSLIIANAERHKRDPAYIDDVVGTVKNSVTRMTRLLDQMTTGVRATPACDVEIGGLLQEVVDQHSVRTPKPTLNLCADEIIARADREQLANVVGHLIQNAQEACQMNGQVEVGLAYLQDGTAAISVRDTGIGMEESFVREQLFQPFISTKGFNGMGVGTFESREYIRSLGGDIEVTSTPGEGSLFRILIPCLPVETGSGKWPLIENTY